MSRVLLVQPPENLERLLGRGKHFAMALPPYGVLSICAYLRQHGVQTEVLDAYYNGYGVEDTVKDILAVNPDVVGISCLTANSPLVVELIKRLKERKPEMKIALGNIHASVFSSFFLKIVGADFVIHHEGEETFLELVHALEKCLKDFSGIHGMSWRDGDTVIDNPLRKKHISLNNIDWPARDSIPFKNYVQGVYDKAESNVSDMIFSSRGCVNKCIFCCVGRHQSYRARDPVDVVDEIEHDYKRYQIEQLTFGDPLFTINEKRVVAICEEIIRRGIKIKWFCEGHARFLKPGMLEAMRDAGCTDIAFGIESGSPRLLPIICKNTTHDEIARATEWVTKAGINAQGLFMLGFPDETESEMMETIRFSCSIPIIRAQFAITTPYPGTQLYDDLIARRELVLKDWEDPGFVEDWYRYSAYISYTDHDPIWVPKGMSSKRLKQIQKLAMRKFYFRPKQFFNEVKKIRLSNFEHAKGLLLAVKDSFM